MKNNKIKASDGKMLRSFLSPSVLLPLTCESIKDFTTQKEKLNLCMEESQVECLRIILEKENTI